MVSMIFQSQYVAEIASVLTFDDIQVIYRFINGYGALVETYIDKPDVKISVLVFNNADIMDHSITTETVASSTPVRHSNVDEYEQVMQQIEQLPSLV